MKYPYIVNKNGVWYPAGTEVPEDANFDEDNSGEDSGSDEGNDSGEDSDTSKENQYTKTDINRMLVAELKQVASEIGIEGFEEMTGAELKKALIEHFGL